MNNFIVLMKFLKIINFYEFSFIILRFNLAYLGYSKKKYNNK